VHSHHQGTPGRPMIPSPSQPEVPCQVKGISPAQAIYTGFSCDLFTIRPLLVTQKDCCWY
jgi:hypothetical protein